MAKKSGKPSGKPSGREMVPQSHGGALLPGAGGGPQPRSGRPTNEIRRLFRGDLEVAREKVLAILEREGEPCEECGRSGAARDDIVVGIFDKLAKYGVGEKRVGAVTVDAELLNEFFIVIGLHLQDEVALADIREKWLDILADRIGA